MDQQPAPIESNNNQSDGNNQGVHGFLVAAFILAEIPILGLIFTIIANKQSKERGKNRELALIALIISIIIHATIVLCILIVVFSVSLGSQSTNDNTDTFDIYEYNSVEVEDEYESLFESNPFLDDLVDN